MSQYDFDLSVSIKQVLDADSKQQVESEIKKTKEKLEEPIKVKVDVKAAKKQLSQLNTEMKELSDAQMKAQDALKKAMGDGDTDRTRNISKDLDRIDAQIKQKETRVKAIRRELNSRKAELKTERAGSRTLTSEEKEIDKLLSETAVKRKVKPKVDVVETQKEIKQTEKLAEAYKKVEDAKTGASKQKSKVDTSGIEQQTDALKENTQVAKKNAEAQKQLNDAVESTQSSSHVKVIDQKIDKLEEKAKAEEKVAAAIERTAEEQKKLDNLNRSSKNQQDWIKYLDEVLDKSNFETSGKREATEKLRSATNYLVSQRRENYEYASGSYAKEMAEVAWMHAYQEAERQGVAQSTLTRYSTDAKYDYERNLKTLQEERDFRQKLLSDAQKEIELINQKIEAQREFNQEKKVESSAQDSNMVYHAGDLSNINQTLKSFRLGNVNPYKESVSFNGFTGLYTTENVDGFWANEWSGAPISTIDLSHYKLFDARNEELVERAKAFFENLNGTIYGYLDFFDPAVTEGLGKTTDVKTVEQLYEEFREVFKNINLDFETFSNFIKNAKAAIAGNHGFIYDLDPTAIDEGIAKSAQNISLQGVSRDVFNSDSFQTQLLKMLGFDGIDLRGTKYNGTYSGGTVIFDIKPESLKTVNGKWSDLMSQHGYEIVEEDLRREEKRRQLAFDTAKAYSKIEQSNKALAEDDHVWDSIKDTVQAEDVDQLQEFIRLSSEAYSNEALEKNISSYSILLNEVSSGGLSAAEAMEQLKDTMSAVKVPSDTSESVSSLDELKAHADALGEEFKESEQYKAIWNGLVADVKSGSKTAAQAIEDLNKAYDNWTLSSSFGTQESPVDNMADSVKLTVKEMSNAFDTVDLGGFLKAFNIAEEDILQIKSEFIELLRLTKAKDLGFDVDDQIDKQLENIIDTIMELGSVGVKVDDIYKEFWSTMSGIKLAYTDSERTEIGKDNLSYFKKQLPGVLFTAASGKGIRVDKNLDKFEKFSSIIDPNGTGILGPEGESNEKDLLIAVIEALIKTKTIAKNGWKDFRNIPESARAGIAGDIAKMWGKTLGSLHADESDTEASKQATQGDADALAEVAEQAPKAAKGKGKFNKANKELRTETKQSTDVVEEETDAMKDMAEQSGQAANEVTEQWDKVSTGADGVVSRSRSRMSEDSTRVVDTVRERIMRDEESGIEIPIRIETKDYSKLEKDIRTHTNSIAKINKNIADVGSLDVFNDKFKAEYKEYLKALEDMREAQKNITSGQGTDADYQKFDAAADKANTLKKSLEGVFKEQEKLKKFGQAIDTTTADTSDVDKLKLSMLELASSVTEGKFELKGFNDAGTEMYGVMKTGADSVQEITVALKAGTNQLTAYKGATKTITNEWDKFKSSVGGGVAKMVGMYVGFHDIIRYARQGVEAVREIDLAMTELKKVTDETEETYARFLSTASKSAGAIGSTITDFTTVTSDFARLGYSIDEAAKLAETALVYENVGDGFSSVDEASESVISTMKAFGIEAQDAMGIVDRFNAVGNNFAITSKGIGDALQRSASALYEGGNTIDESIALVTAANSVIQNPEQVGEWLADYKAA